MNPEEWKKVFEVFDPLDELPEGLDGIGQAITDGSAQIADSVNNLAQAIAATNDLAVLALEMLFVFGFAFMAYWRRQTTAYVLASLVSFMMGFVWLAQRTEADYMLIMGTAAIGLGLVLLVAPVMTAVNYFRGD